jgi:hypothetical protein
MQSAVKPHVEFLFFVIREKLSDGSEVFNVQLGDIRFPAVTQDDALELAEKLSDAINDHTTTTAAVVDEG